MMTKAAPEAWGRLVRNSSSASKPPAEAPMPTIVSVPLLVAAPVLFDVTLGRGLELFFTIQILFLNTV
jgi:hypothetical protein